MRIISLSREFNQKFCSTPAFLQLESFEQHFMRLEWISAQMEAAASK